MKVLLDQLSITIVDYLETVRVATLRLCLVHRSESQSHPDTFSAWHVIIRLVRELRLRRLREFIVG